MTQSANLNNVNAMFKLGVIYERYYFTEKSIHYYLLAANKGHPDSLFAVGNYYIYQTFGANFFHVIDIY